MGNSKQPFYFITAACAANIVLDLIIVYMFTGNWKRNAVRHAIS
jgi:Na+-driven multidrug efflux pump